MRANLHNNVNKSNIEQRNLNFDIYFLYTLDIASLNVTVALMIIICVICSKLPRERVVAATKRLQSNKSPALTTMSYWDAIGTNGIT